MRDLIADRRKWPDMGVRILCYNIHGGYDMHGKRDLKRLHALLQTYNIDIGVFQEIETRPSRGGTLRDIETIAGPERPHHLPGLALSEGEGWYGNLIVSRFPILRGIVHNLETSKRHEPRNAVDTVIETPNSLLRIIGTHLSLSPFERWSEVRNLVRLIDQVEEKEVHPMLVMGDINEWRSSSRLLRHLNELFSPLDCGKTFPSFWPAFRLDRVWHHNMPLEPKIRIVSTPEVKRLSDHLPLLVEVF